MRTEEAALGKVGGDSSQGLEVDDVKLVAAQGIRRLRAFARRVYRSSLERLSDRAECFVSGAERLVTGQCRVGSLGGGLLAKMLARPRGDTRLNL